MMLLQKEQELSNLLSLFAGDNGDTGDGDGDEGNESPTRSRNRVFISDLLVESGRLAIKYRLFDLAQSFVELFEDINFPFGESFFWKIPVALQNLPFENLTCILSDLTFSKFSLLASLQFFGTVII